MTKILVIAEKPSVALDISKALGKFQKKTDYYESEDYIVGSAVGHLLEIRCPEDLEAKRGKWTFKHLPITPPHFDLRPIAKSEARLNSLLRLINRKDVSALVNACDAGREGELIFRLIVQYAKTNKPIKRLWLQSMTPNSIREGFAALQSDQKMLPLADAARCRAEADWLVGINGTRAMTAFNSQEGGFHLTTVGRVQTPTLAILTEREQKIRAFVSRPYWEVHGTFVSETGVSYTGRWFDQKFTRSEDEHHKAERLWDEATAKDIIKRCLKQKATVSEEAKPMTQSSPLLFDLTSLQREANGRFGFSARNTLSIAQALYEKHKVLTYPRTDARALPEDYIATVRKTIQNLGEQSGYAPHANRILKESWVKPNKRIFNNSKISDHFAIIPTLQTPKNLSEPEQKIYDMVVRRFLAIFHPPAEFLQTVRISAIKNDVFRSEGKVLVSPGWMQVYGREAEAEESQLPALPKNAAIHAETVEAKANHTKPPPRYNEATLLSAMEGAGKMVEDEELREAMEQKGLGTPATRASIIEGLIHEEYVLREQRELIPTSKAFSLMFALKNLDVSDITSPGLTGEWEHRLRQIEQGSLKRKTFMTEITEATVQMIERIRKGKIPETAFATLSSPCPKCQGKVIENYRKFQCESCDFSLWKTIAGRQLETTEADLLLSTKTVGPLDGFRSRLGRPFSAMLKLGDDYQTQFEFAQNPNSINLDTDIQFKNGDHVGECPKCKGDVYEHEAGYLCKNAVGTSRNCDFRASKVILKQTIDQKQIGLLLKKGRTELLENFISKKGRKFKAFLVLQAGGKIGFEFEQKKTKAVVDAAKKVTASTTSAPETPEKAPKKTPRKSSSSLTRSVIPSAALAAIVGDTPLPRTEITKKLWEYIKQHELQDSTDRRNINPDKKLEAVFGTKDTVSMFQMTRLVNNNVS